MDDLVVERVLVAIEQVPRGRVVSYGDIGHLVGIGARQVGLIMRHWGSNVAWWRVVNASGELPVPLLERARPHWADEGILVKRNGRGCAMGDYRVDLAQWAVRYQDATAELPAE